MIGQLTLFDFITSPRLRKMVIPNLIWRVKILIPEFGSLVTCGEGVRHPTMLVLKQPFVLVKS